MKKNICKILTVITTIILVAMSLLPIPANAQDDIRMVVIGVESGGSYWGNIEQGYREALNEVGYEGEYWTPQNAGNDAEMVQLAENALTQGFDVIAMEVNDLDMYGDIIVRAKEQGTILISLTDIGEENASAFVGIEPYSSGFSQGAQAAEFATDLGFESITYITLMSAVNNPSQLRYRDGIADGLSENFSGPVEEVEATSTDSNAAVAQDKLNAYYLANPNLNIATSTDLYGALGASQFVSENGLQGEFITIGLELTADAFNRVLDGDLMATSSVDSVGIGRNFVYVAQKIIEGEEYEYLNPAERIWVFPDEVEDYASEHNIELN